MSILAIKKAIILPGIISTMVVGTETVNVQDREQSVADKQAGIESREVLTQRGYRMMSQSQDKSGPFLTMSDVSAESVIQTRRGQRDVLQMAASDELDWGLGGQQRQQSRQ